MFLEALTASDNRFTSLRFKDGLNILIADRTETADLGDSRNSVGKTSAVKILRYLMAGELPDEFRAPELTDHTFTAVLHLPALSGKLESVQVSRAVSPTTRVHVSGWSITNSSTEMHVDEWRELLARHVFHIPLGVNRPTVGQLWGQLVRTYFGNPVKGHPSEADWESGVKLGFMLGMSPEILSQAGALDRLTKQGKALRAAVREGAIPHLSLDESALRAQLVTARRQRDRMQEDLRSLKVDDQYAEHQRRADYLTGAIQRCNEEALLLQRRESELLEVLWEEVAQDDGLGAAQRLEAVYAELGVILPEAVSRRYDEVRAFHESVVRNRRAFLEQERDAVVGRLKAVDVDRRNFDEQRAQVMQLLNDAVALDTFLHLQRSLGALEAEVVDLERRLEAATSVSAIGDQIKLQTAELVALVRTEVYERNESLDASIALFGELGAEIYKSREDVSTSLLIHPTARGLLGVEPQISGDAGVGVRSVETFMLDLVCVIAALGAGRAPAVLVHDSHLFDAIDGRRAGTCLRIGARLAEAFGFQYVVTLNSDFMETVVRQGNGAFDPRPYVLEARLTDETETAWWRLKCVPQLLARMFHRVTASA